MFGWLDIAVRRLLEANQALGLRPYHTQPRNGSHKHSKSCHHPGKSSRLALYPASVGWARINTTGEKGNKFYSCLSVNFSIEERKFVMAGRCIEKHVV